jgi:hypothetical protein
MENCYGQRGYYKYPGTKAHLSNMYEISLGKDFPEKVLEFIKRKEGTKYPVKFVRVHVTGDFYSASYIDKWKEIITGAEETTFRTTTRQIGLTDKIYELSSLPNMIIRESLDNPFSYEIENVAMDEDGDWDFDITRESGRLEPSMGLPFTAPDPLINLESEEFNGLALKLEELAGERGNELVQMIEVNLLKYRLPVLSEELALICSGQCQDCADLSYPFEGGYFCWKSEGNARYPSPRAEKHIAALNRRAEKEDIKEIEIYLDKKMYAEVLNVC